MSGNRFLLDTNAIIALLQGNLSITSIVKEAEWIGVSIISVIEFLSFSNLSDIDKKLLNNLLNKIEVVELTMSNQQIIAAISSIRVKYKLKLPDATVAASAFMNLATLVTADRGFNKVTELIVIDF
jgi:predicted nucleic acid-binding protein